MSFSSANALHSQIPSEQPQTTSRSYVYGVTFAKLVYKAVSTFGKNKI